MRRLRAAERALLAQVRYSGMNPVELGGELGFSPTGEEHKGARPDPDTTASMHTYGLAVDVLYSKNPWVKGPGFTRALTRAALLVSGEVIAQHTSASYFESLRSGRTTAQIFDVLTRRDQDFRTYLRLGSDRPALLGLLRQRRAAASPGVFAAAAETDEQAANRWQREILRDLGNMQGAGSPFLSGTTRDPRHGFLNLHRDLVVALRDDGCLAWGAVDIGAGEASGNGDMMHFDARVGGLGDLLAAEGGNKRVQADHPCLAR
jgi:hypothetical protein